MIQIRHRDAVQLRGRHPGLLLQLAQCGACHRGVTRLEVPAGLHPEPALAVEAQQHVRCVVVEDEGARRDVRRRPRALQGCLAVVAKRIDEVSARALLGVVAGAPLVDGGRSRMRKSALIPRR